MSQPQFKTGEICHTELTSDDLEATKTFFSKVFGWTYETVPMPEGGDYHFWQVDGEPKGGLTAVQPNMNAGVLNFLTVDNVDETLAQIEAAGGKVLSPGMDVGEHGRMGVFEAPGGPGFGLWQAFEKATE